MKVKLGMSLDYEVIEKIRELAEKEERSVSQYINIVLKQHIAALAAEDAAK